MANVFNKILALFGYRPAVRIERLERERTNWIEDAYRESQNTQYYRGLLVEIGKLLGPAAYTQDDGGHVDDVLVAKVPRLVRERLTAPGVSDYGERPGNPDVQSSGGVAKQKGNS